MNLVEAPEDRLHVSVGLLIVLTSGVGFLLLRHILPLCSAERRKESQRPKSPNDANWFNVWMSLIHSLITGIWCLACFYNNPEMAEDLIKGHGQSAYCLVCVSTGYFLYDVVDYLMNFPFSKAWEILLHHFVVITCFGLSVLIHTYVGFAVVALLVEINSVFLHIRQLLQMMGFPKDRMVFRINCVVNLGTFVVFRICTLTWMTRWLVHNRQIPQPYHTIGSVGMAIMTIMNSVLFLRLLWKDCLRRGITKTCEVGEPARANGELPLKANARVHDKLD